jgi:hypothetical protein
VRGAEGRWRDLRARQEAARAAGLDCERIDALLRLVGQRLVGRSSSRDLWDAIDA